jgi:triosephosphate isomerase
MNKRMESHMNRNRDSNKRLVIGNWKMKIDHNEGRELIHKLSHVLKDADDADNAEVIVLPSFTAIHPVCQYAGKHHIPITIGAQTVSDVQGGAYTGDVSAFMLAALGCKYVLVGHSERRRYHHEDDACIRRKLRAVLDAGMTPILCVGDNAEDHDATDQNSLTASTELRSPSSYDDESWASVTGQLSVLSDLDPYETARIVIAYEPVWAIGTGNVPTVDEIDRMVSRIRHHVTQFHGAGRIPVLYGGSVNEDNADKIADIPSVSGVLVGGASVDAEPFGKIIGAFI